MYRYRDFERKQQTERADIETRHPREGGKPVSVVFENCWGTSRLLEHAGTRPCLQIENEQPTQRPQGASRRTILRHDTE
jgi:hypothetical protein